MVLNTLDKQYLDLLKDVKENGTYKNTRSGEVVSTFGKMLTFDMSEGFPLLTTKKMFTKGIIHELLWFLGKGTNIKYLIDNNVHIWDDDAYRYYTEKYNRHLFQFKRSYPDKTCDLKLLTKEEFLQNVNEQKQEKFIIRINDCRNPIIEYYTYGDVGKIYGYQWNSFDGKIDQIKNLENKLYYAPNDRRMLCIAFNPAQLYEMALPPCHVMFQLYTRELTNCERFKILGERFQPEYDEWKTVSDEILNEKKIPKYGLSLLWTQRSVDVFLGLPFNIASYGLLLSMFANSHNMVPDKLICSLGDTHIYLNQMDAVDEQLTHDPYKFNLPKLKLLKKRLTVLAYKPEDIEIENYESYPKINAPLNVGL
jgi:thymidylate synthase